MLKFKIAIFLIFAPICAFASEFSHGISVFGDLKYGKNFKHFDYVNKNAPKFGKVRFAAQGGFNNLNQFLLKGISPAGLSYIYDSLTVASDDEISSRYGLIAKEIKLAANKKSIIFKLRQNAFFHDGHNIDADDVVFTFNILLKEGHPSYKIMFRDVSEVKKLSKYVVKFDFKHNKNRDLPILVASLPVLPKHYYEKVDFAKTTLDAPLGSGPYKISDVKINHSITYERVKNYWAKDLAVNLGRFNFDEIRYDYYHDVNILVEALKAQKYDFRQENIARNWATAYNVEAVKNGEIIKEKIPHLLPAPMQSFVFNLRKEKFQDVNLRKAISYAFDFEWLNKHIFYGEYQRTNSFFANSIFGFNKFKMPISDGSGFNRDNLLKAKEFLDNSGYVVKEGQLFDKNGKAVSLEILIHSESFKMVVLPFIKNLKKLGINAKARFIEENQYQTRLNNFDYDMVVGIFGQALIPGNELFAYFHSSQKNIKGGRNLIGLDLKEVDNLVVKIAKAKNKETLKNLCRKLDKILLQGYFVIGQWHNNNYRILYRDIFAKPSKTPKYSLAIDTWWLKK